MDTPCSPNREFPTRFFKPRPDVSRPTIMQVLEELEGLMGRGHNLANGWRLPPKRSLKNLANCWRLGWRFFVPVQGRGTKLLAIRLAIGQLNRPLGRLA